VIISQTPYRVSFAGGGTDLPAFYRQDFGAVLSLTIARHIYVTVHGRFQPNIRVAYSKVETRQSVQELEHELVREVLRLTDLGPPLEITTVGDVPGGTGMGSSSSCTVGLLHALYAYKGCIMNSRQLAEQACDIELDVLGKPIGRQDQYAAAFGGLNYIRFNSDDTVDVEPVPVKLDTLRELEKRMILLYTERQRDADTILKQQSDGTKDRLEVLLKMRDLAAEMRASLTDDADLDELGRLLDDGWRLKRSLGFGISDRAIDDWYEAARRAGAQGGKLLGAGGGGFLLLMAPEDRHEAIREALDRPRELPFQIDRQGSRIIFISEHH